MREQLLSTRNILNELFCLVQNSDGVSDMDESAGSTGFDKLKFDESGWLYEHNPCWDDKTARSFRIGGLIVGLRRGRDAGSPDCDERLWECCKVPEKHSCLSPLLSDDRDGEAELETQGCSALNSKPFEWKYPPLDSLEPAGSCSGEDDHSAVGNDFPFMKLSVRWVEKMLKGGDRGGYSTPTHWF